MEGDKGELGEQAILKLLSALDEHIPLPQRDVDKPFLMSVEDVFSITGRGTVAAGPGAPGRGEGEVGEV